MLAADPSHPGHFAVMIVNGNAELQVYFTNNSGKTWNPPITAGSVPGGTVVRTDLSYSPKGGLALMWLAASRQDLHCLGPRPCTMGEPPSASRSVSVPPRSLRE
jgi:hypothetical protein